MQINKLQLNFNLESFQVKKASQTQQENINYFEKYSSRIIHSYIYSSIYPFLTKLRDNTQEVLTKIQEKQPSLYKKLIANQNFIEDFEDKKISFNFNYFLQSRIDKTAKNENNTFNSLSVFVTSSSSLLLDILKYIVDKEIVFNKENDIKIDGTFNLKNETVFYQMSILSCFDKTLNFELKDKNFELKVRNFNYFFDKKSDIKDSFYYNEKSIVGIKSYLSSILGIGDEQIIFDKNGFLKKINILQKKEYDIKTKSIVFGENSVNFAIVDFNCILQKLTPEQELKLEYWINEGFGNKNCFGFGNVDVSAYITMNKYNYKESNKNRIDKRRDRIAALLCS